MTVYETTTTLPCACGRPHYVIHNFVTGVNRCPKEGK